MSDKQPKSDPAEHGEKQSQDDSVSGAPKPASRHWAWRHKLLVVIGVFVSLGFAHYLLTRPTDNPQPQKKIVVRGSFPYDRGWDLRIEASYYSKNPTCKQTARAFFIFPQAEVSREAWRTIPVIREGDSRYRFEFFEDAVSPGFCEWSMRFVNYRIYSAGKEIQGGAILGFPGRFNVIRYGCSNITSTYFRSPDRTPIAETGVACYEGDNHWKDPSQSDALIDFIWEENTK